MLSRFISVVTTLFDRNVYRAAGEPESIEAPCNNR